jgi:hypothetical protein
MLMHAIIEVIKMDCDLVARYGQEFNEPQLERFGSGMSVLESVEELCKGIRVNTMVGSNVSLKSLVLLRTPGHSEV